LTSITTPVRASGFHPLRATGAGAAPARRKAVRSGRGAGAFLTDGFSLLLLVLSIPFVILGLGLPLALAARFVLWIFRVL
jgi:hypothetical protein